MTPITDLIISQEKCSITAPHHNPKLGKLILLRCCTNWAELLHRVKSKILQDLSHVVCVCVSRVVTIELVVRGLGSAGTARTHWVDRRARTGALSPPDSTPDLLRAPGAAPARLTPYVTASVGRHGSVFASCPSSFEPFKEAGFQSVVKQCSYDHV